MMNYETISEFKGPTRFLSNFWLSDFSLWSFEWSSVEHAYQAGKAGDGQNGIQDFMWIQESLSPGVAKRRGQSIILREDWEEVKISVMRACIEAKFTQDVSLARDLLGTGYGVLIEGNSWNDTFWGQCNGVGENHLGRILMDLRHRLRFSNPAAIVAGEPTNKKEVTRT
jgi:ribA/ribD-fused uncharacterized protein